MNELETYLFNELVERVKVLEEVNERNSICFGAICFAFIGLCVLLIVVLICFYFNYKGHDR